MRTNSKRGKKPVALIWKGKKKKEKERKNTQ